jgi:hypothetical protein
MVASCEAWPYIAAMEARPLPYEQDPDWLLDELNFAKAREAEISPLKLSRQATKLAKEFEAYIDPREPRLTTLLESAKRVGKTTLQGPCLAMALAVGYPYYPVLVSRGNQPQVEQQYTDPTRPQ